MCDNPKPKNKGSSPCSAALNPSGTSEPSFLRYKFSLRQNSLLNEYIQITNFGFQGPARLLLNPILALFVIQYLLFPIYLTLYTVPYMLHPMCFPYMLHPMCFVLNAWHLFTLPHSQHLVCYSQPTPFTICKAHSLISCLLYPILDALFAIPYLLIPICYTLFVIPY